MIEQVEVTREDREVAAIIFDSLGGGTIPRNFGEKVRSGERSELVGIIARHRIAAQEQAIKAAIEEACAEIQREIDLWSDCYETAEHLRGSVRDLDTTQIMKGLSDD